MMSMCPSNGGLETVLATGEAVYVVNNTEPRGQLICTVENPSSGKPHQLVFPKTWIPMCLTDMLPREVIEQSIELRQFFNKRLLKVVEAKTAQEILQSPKGKKEYNRLVQSQFSGGGEGGTQRDQLAKAAEVNKQAGLENPEVNRDAMPMHPKLKVWEQRILAGEIDGSALDSELEIHSEEFTLEDLQYLLAGQFPSEAKTFAYESLKNNKFRTKELAKPQAIPRANPASYEGDWS